jgi:hypothetical protein
VGDPKSEETVAVKVTCCPTMDGFRLEPNVVVDGYALRTASPRMDETLGAKFESPR